VDFVKTTYILFCCLFLSVIHIFAQNPKKNAAISDLGRITAQLDSKGQKELLAYAEYLLLKKKETPEEREARHHQADEKMPTDETAAKIADYYRYAVSVQETPLQLLERDDRPVAAIEFDVTEHEFGQVARGSVVKHDYSFTNISEHELLLYDVDATCGCTVAEWPRSSIPPGGKGTISVVFDTSFKSGKQAKVVKVLSNTDPRWTPLVIKGEVLP
jgi:hypothetical protein